MDKAFTELQELLEGRVEENISLSDFCTFKIGGPAKYLFIAQTNEDLVRAVVFSKKLKIPFILLSGGSNVLIADEGYKGLVIILRTNDIIFKDGNKVVVDSGVVLMDLVEATVEHGLTGLEWAAGIPGDVGGAVRGNAGAYGGEIKDSLTGVEVMRGAKQFILPNEKCGFSYRHSIFKENSDIIITAEFQLTPGNKEASKKKVSEILDQRNTKIPEGPSAGCVFKNIPITSENMETFKNLRVPDLFFERGKVPTGYLIDELGLRGMTIGGAKISENHGNIIVNTGDATASDVLQIMSIMKMKVRDTYGIQLVEEIQYIA